MFDQEENVEEPNQLSRLPTEMLTHIFAKLDSKSKGRCAQVCRSWKNMVDQEALWRDDTFLWWSHYMKNPDVRETLKLRKMRKVALKISAEDGTVCMDKLLEEVTSSMPGPFQLTELLITDNRKIGDRTVIDESGLFAHLVRLDVGRLPQVVTDIFVNRVAICCTRLTQLSLGDCSSLTMIGYNRIMGGWIGGDQDWFISFPLLERIAMDECSYLTNWHLSFLNLRLPRLRQLSLKHALRLSDSGLLNLSDLRQLEELSIRGVSRITSKGIEAFAALSQADVLKLDHCVCQCASAIHVLRIKFSQCDLRTFSRP